MVDGHASLRDDFDTSTRADGRRRRRTQRDRRRVRRAHDRWRLRRVPRRDLRAGHAPRRLGRQGVGRGASARRQTADGAAASERPTRTGPDRRPRRCARPGAPRSARRGVGPRTRTARSARRRGRVAVAAISSSSTVGYAAGSATGTRSIPRWASRSAPYVAGEIVIHGRRQIGTNAVRRAMRSARLGELAGHVRHRRRRSVAAELAHHVRRRPTGR